MAGDRQSTFVPDIPTKKVVPVLLLLFVVLATLYSVVTPLFEGNDEPWHYAYVDYLLTHGELPRQPPEAYPHLARQEASQPPLYYALAAALTGWVAADDLAVYLEENPFYRIESVAYRDNQNHMIHTDAERFPYQGAVLAVHLARLLSVLLGAGTVYCTYALCTTLFPGESDLATGAMLVTALTPSFLFTSGLVSNDALIIFLAALALLLLARLWRRPLSYGTVSLLGVVLGCAALTKLSGFLLWPLAGMVLVLVAWRDRRPGRLFTTAGLAFLLAGLVSGWWLARNGTLYGDVTGLNEMLNLVGRREPGFGLRDLPAEIDAIRRSYWALFGWLNLPAPDWLYVFFDLASLVALVGLGLYVVRAVRDRRWNDLLAVAFLITWAAISLAGLLRWTLTTGGSQGRLLYPAIGAIAILFVRGWLGLPIRGVKARRWTIMGLGAAFVLIAAGVPFLVIRPAYARPATLVAADVDRYVSRRVAVRFGDRITLLGYGVDRRQAGPGDVVWVTACWQGEAAIAENVFVFARLLVDHDLVAAEKHTYHGGGNYATSLWPPGIILCDRYPLVVADAAPPSTAGTVVLGLYDRAGSPLPVTSADGQVLGDSVRLDDTIVLVDGEETLDYQWGHDIGLVDYQLEAMAVAPGEDLEITLFWQAREAMPVDYVVTVQLMDAQWNKIAQDDAVPGGDGLPPTVWEPGSVVADRRVLAIPVDAPPGVYAIKVAVYEPSTTRNLALYHGRHVLPAGGLLTLWTVRVLAVEP